MVKKDPVSISDHRSRFHMYSKYSMIPKCCLSPSCVGCEVFRGLIAEVSWPLSHHLSVHIHIHHNFSRLFLDPLFSFPSMFGGCAYLKLVLAGLSLRRGVEEIDSENLEDNSSATEFFLTMMLCISTQATRRKGHGAVRIESDRDRGWFGSRARAYHLDDL